MEYAKIIREISAPKDRLLLIDGLNRWISVWSAVPVLSSDGRHIGAISGFLQSIGVLIRQFNPTKCIIVFDGPGGSNRRKKKFPGYKSGRMIKRGEYSSSVFATEEEERESMRMQFKRTMEYLSLLPVDIVSIPEIEGDDSIAHIAKNCEEEVVIVSTDRDFLQLVNSRINVWNPIRKKLYDIDTLHEEYGVFHENFLLFRALTGDAGDSIPGIKGLGLKTLIKNFPDISNRYLELFEIIELCKKKNNKCSEGILEGIEIIERNIDLMQLYDVDISLHSKNQIRDILLMDKKYDRISIIRNAKIDGISERWGIEKWLTETFNTLSLKR